MPNEQRVFFPLPEHVAMAGGGLELVVMNFLWYNLFSYGQFVQQTSEQ